MRLRHFFIVRPIFAMVLSMVMVIVGAIAYFTLPVAQFPEIVPPTVTVSASYPGASAQTVAPPASVGSAARALRCWRTFTALWVLAGG